MVRNIGGFLLGAVTAGLVVATLQQLSFTLHPMPEGLDPRDPAQADAFANFVASMPVSAWAGAMLSEVVGFFCGALATGWIVTSRIRLWTGGIVLIGVVGSVNNWIQFTHPTWFIIAQVVLYPTVLLAVWKILDAKKPPAQAEGLPT